MQFACIVWFTLETFTRFITCKDKRTFVKSLANVIDIVSVLPVYVLLVTGVRKGAYALSVLRFLRVTRFFEAFASRKFLRQLKMIQLSVVSSAPDLLTCSFVILFIMVLFSCLLYSSEWVLEMGSEDFSDVVSAFWFSLVTLTSLGYGEMTPLTTAGKLVTVLMISCTIIVLALPVPIIVSNFVVANELLKNDDTVATYHFDENKSNQVREELRQLFPNGNAERIHCSVNTRTTRTTTEC